MISYFHIIVWSYDVITYDILVLCKTYDIIKVSYYHINLHLVGKVSRIFCTEHVQPCSMTGSYWLPAATDEQTLSVILANQRYDFHCSSYVSLSPSCSPANMHASLRLP